MPFLFNIKKENGVKRMREYYVLFSCDDWKSHSSMSLIGVFSRKKLEKTIRKFVKDGSMKFNRELKTLPELSVHDIEVALEFGFIQSIHLNEIN